MSQQAQRHMNVGVKHIRNNLGSPVRVFYPAADVSALSRVHTNALWMRTPLHSIVEGYCHVFGG